MSVGNATARGVTVQPYRIVCLVALGAVLFALSENGMGFEFLFLGAVGALSLVRAWTSGPLLLVVAVAVVLFLRHYYGLSPFATHGIQANDLVLDAGMLTYVASFYRLRSVIAEILPVDPRRIRGLPWRQVRRMRQARSPQLVSQNEVVTLVLAAAVSALLAQAVWFVVNPQRDPFAQGSALARFTAVVFVLAISFWVPAWILDYAERRLMSGREALMVLQESAWRDTRLEQARINRWVVWGGLLAWRRRRGAQAAEEETSDA